MTKCTFILKEKENEIKEVTEMKTDKDIQDILVNQANKHFSVKIVDEYIFIDREFTQHEYEGLVVPHMVRISTNQFKK